MLKKLDDLSLEKTVGGAKHIWRCYGVDEFICSKKEYKSLVMENLIFNGRITIEDCKRAINYLAILRFSTMIIVDLCRYEITHSPIYANLIVI